MTQYGLDANVVQSICLVFSKFEKIQQVTLFGSRAKGNFQSGSDIDLTIKNSDISHTDMLNIQIALDDLDLLYKIDLLNYNTIKEPALKDHIDRVGVVFYEKKSEFYRI